MRRPCAPQSRLPGSAARHLIHFASRDAMDIEGLGPAVLEQLMDAGLITHVYDLYALDRDAVAALDRMGDKSADNLLAALEKSKDAGLDRVIFSLGIRHIGQKAAKLLAGRFGTMQAVMEASLEEIAAIDGFGDIMAESVVRFFELEPSRQMVEELEKAGVRMVDTSEQTDDRFCRHDLCPHRHPAHSEARRGCRPHREIRRQNGGQCIEKDLRRPGG